MQKKVIGSENMMLRAIGNESNRLEMITIVVFRKAPMRASVLQSSNSWRKAKWNFLV